MIFDLYLLTFLVFIGPSASRFHPRGAYITVHNVGAGGMLSGHRFPPHVSAPDCAAFGGFKCRVADDGETADFFIV